MLLFLLVVPGTPLSYVLYAAVGAGVHLAGPLGQHQPPAPRHGAQVRPGPARREALERRLTGSRPASDRAAAESAEAGARPWRASRVRDPAGPAVTVAARRQTARDQARPRRRVDRSAVPAGSGSAVSTAGAPRSDLSLPGQHRRRLGRLGAERRNRAGPTALPEPHPGARPTTASRAARADPTPGVATTCRPSVADAALERRRADRRQWNDPGRLTTRVVDHAGSAGRESARAERVLAISRRAGCGSNRCSRRACRWSGGTGPGPRGRSSSMSR